MNNVEHSFTHYKTNSHNMWRNWERKHKQGKEVVKSIATDMSGTVWSHDITLLFAVFLYIEQISVESNNNNCSTDEKQKAVSSREFRLCTQQRQKINSNQRGANNRSDTKCALFYLWFIYEIWNDQLVCEKTDKYSYTFWTGTNVTNTVSA